MPDFADKSSNDSEAALEFAIQRHRFNMSTMKPLKKGVCQNCLNPVSVGSYCDQDCREDHEKDLKAQQRNGAH